MLPGTSQILIDNEKLTCIAGRVRDIAPFASAVESLIVDHDGAAAAEDLLRFYADVASVDAFIGAVDECGAAVASTWSAQGIGQLAIGAAATNAIISAVDFVTNYLLNYRSEVSFTWVQPKPTPTPTSPPPPLATGPESTMVAFWQAYNERDWQRYLSLLTDCLADMLNSGNFLVDDPLLELQEIRAGTGRVTLLEVADVSISGATATASVTAEAEFGFGVAGPAVAGDVYFFALENGSWKVTLESC